MQIYFIYRLRTDFNQSQVPNNITPATQHKSTLAKTCFLGDVPQLEEKQSAHRIPGGSPPSLARFEMKISIVTASVVSRYQRGCSSCVFLIDVARANRRGTRKEMHRNSLKASVLSCLPIITWKRKAWSTTLPRWKEVKNLLHPRYGSSRLCLGFQC